MAMFAEDATLYTPGMPPASGREAIKTVMEGVLKDPALDVAIDEVSRKVWIFASGDLATTTYRFLSDPNAAVTSVCSRLGTR